MGQGHGDKTRQERELTFNIKRMLGTVLSTLQTPDTIALTIGNEIIDYYPILKMWKLRLRMMVFPRSQVLAYSVPKYVQCSLGLIIHSMHTTTL